MPEKTSAISVNAPSAAFSLVHPLDEFYAQAGQPLPPLNEVDGEAVPEPSSAATLSPEKRALLLQRIRARKAVPAERR